MVSAFKRTYVSLYRLILPTGASSSIRRQKAKEEMVEGKGYVHQHPAYASLVALEFALMTGAGWSLHLKASITNSQSVKDKANHAVVLDKATSDKLNKDVQSYRLITVAVLVDRLKINGSLARKALNDLEERGVIKKVVGHSRGSIYTRAAAGGD